MSSSGTNGVPTVLKGLPPSAAIRTTSVSLAIAVVVMTSCVRRIPPQPASSVRTVSEARHPPDTATTPRPSVEPLSDRKIVWEESIFDKEKIEAPIHFAFDRYDLSPDAASRLDRKLVVMNRSPWLRIVIEGHGDERGSDEYNIVLGRRRAVAAKQYLTDRGIAAWRITTETFGSERPLRIDSTEEAWAMNRRAEFRIVTSYER